MTPAPPKNATFLFAAGLVRDVHNAAGEKVGRIRLTRDAGVQRDGHLLVGVHFEWSQPPDDERYYGQVAVADTRPPNYAAERGVAGPHVCTCGDCEVEGFDDRCKYELMLIRLVGDVDGATRGAIPRQAIETAKSLLEADDA